MNFCPVSILLVSRLVIDVPMPYYLITPRRLPNFQSHPQH